ncbi:MAG: hypothetical protein HY900_06830 [Deltaproteobacteria bacterium]|nr:hypothetical protein [Deltaproteobacteria bacterium]
MPRVDLPEVAQVAEAIRAGVERKLGKRRTVYTGEDLIEDVGLSPEQFEELVSELEEEFSVEFDPDSLDHLTTAGALLVRLLRLCSREHPGDMFQEVA